MTTETLLPVKKDRRAYNQAYYLRNKEKINQQSRDYYVAHREEVIQKSAAWRKANPIRTKAIIAKSTWAKEHPDRRRAIVEKWKEANPEEHKQTMIRGAKKQRAIRKEMGFEPLNDVFEGAQGHHVNNDQVIYIPEELHRGVRHNMKTGEGMAEINALAFQYLFEHT